MKLRFWTMVGMMGTFLIGLLIGWIWLPRATASYHREVETPGTAVSRPQDRSRGKSREMAASEREKRFDRGEAGQWLRGLAKQNAWKDDPRALPRMVEQCAALNEEEARELVLSLVDILRARKEGDRELRSLFPSGKWLESVGLMAAAGRYSQLNPHAALDLAGEDPAFWDDEKIIQTLYSNLADVDPQEAIRRAEHLPDDGARRAVMEPILGTIFPGDPQRAIAVLETLPGPEFDGERRKVAERLVAQDPQAGIDYAVKATQAGANPSVIAAAVATWMYIDPESAVKWGEAYEGPGADQFQKVFDQMRAKH